MFLGFCTSHITNWVTFSLLLDLCACPYPSLVPAATICLFLWKFVYLEVCISEKNKGAHLKTWNAQKCAGLCLVNLPSSCAHLRLMQGQNLAICIRFYQMGSKKCGFCSETHLMTFQKLDTKCFVLFSADSVSSSLSCYFDVPFLTLTMVLFHSVLHLLSFVLNKVQVLNYSKLFSPSKQSL